MVAETDHGDPDRGLNLGRLASGVGGGILGALLFGLLVEATLTDLTVAMAVPGVYGIEGPVPVAGWGLHLFHGGLLGIVYVIAAQYEPVAKYAHDDWSAVGLGVVFGFVLTALVALVVTPVWFGVVGGGGVFDLPTITQEIVLATLGGHILFGTVVALTYVRYVTRYNPDTEPDEVLP